MQPDPNRPPDDNKLRELILFIAKQSRGDERFGSVKLNKLLFFSDFLAYVRLGSSITGQEYQCLKKGPAPRKLLPIIKSMKRSGALTIEDREYHGHTQKVPTALREPNLAEFTAEEIGIVTEVLVAHYRKNAKSISSKSHEFSGWQLAREGETIPYQTALVRFLKVRKKDLETAQKMKAELVALKKTCP